VGDKVIAMGEHKSCAKLGALLYNQRRAPKDAAVIGGGRVGRSVARGLMRAGWRVTVVDKSEERCRKVAESTEALVLHGDGTDVAFLEQEGIPDRQVVIAVTDSDEKNLLVSLVVKQLGGSRVVTRADRLTNEKLFERVGVDVVRSAKGAAIRTVLRFIDEAESEILAELEHGEACVLEITVRESSEPIAMSDLAPPAYAVVGAILRGEKTIIPGGADSLAPLDHLFVFCSREDQEAIHDYFEHPRPAPKD
jgi:trk system potassium uptake protein TrkA